MILDSRTLSPSILRWLRGRRDSPICEIGDTRSVTKRDHAAANLQGIRLLAAMFEPLKKFGRNNGSKDN